MRSLLIMSRIGKKPIEILDGVEAKIEEGKIFIKGPKGELSRELFSDLNIEIKDREIIISLEKKDKKTGALWGLERSLINNMIEGVKNGFIKKLELVGVGYKARIEGKDLVLDIGFSHPVKIEAPQGIEFNVEGSFVSISGFDKELVGQIAAKIRKIRPPEPYKGKGIRYEGEIVRKKLGKKAVGSA